MFSNLSLLHLFVSEDEGAVETKTEETKEKKKKCVVETNMMKRQKNRGKSEEVDLDIWGVF